MNKLILVGLALVLLVQGSQALDCSGISPQNYEVCKSILNSNLTLAEKEALISNLEYTNKYFPDHNYIYLRNSVLKIVNAPVGIQKTQSNYIKDAWVSIFTLMPSVLYNNTIFTPKKTLVLIGYNYRLYIPSNYYSSGYPQKSDGDCKRIYKLSQNTSELKVFSNGAYQGSDRLVNVSINERSQITVYYNIFAQISIEHYLWNQYCTKYKNGKCLKYSYKCEFSNTNVKKDQVNLIDSILATEYKNNLYAQVIPIESYGSTTKLFTNFSNSIELSFNSSYFNHYQYIYSINYSKSPYYVAQLEAFDYNQDQVNNLIRQKDSLIIKNAKECKVRYYDLFNTFNANCNVNYYGTEFKISTDQFYYRDNQTITVRIHPSDLVLNVTYNNITKQGKGNITFITNYPENKIVTTYDDDKYDKIIFIYEEDKLLILWHLGIFIFLLYLFYVVARKYFRRVK